MFVIGRKPVILLKVLRKMFRWNKTVVQNSADRANVSVLRVEEEGGSKTFNRWMHTWVCFVFYTHKKKINTEKIAFILVEGLSINLSISTVKDYHLHKMLIKKFIVLVKKFKFSSKWVNFKKLRIQLLKL